MDLKKNDWETSYLRKDNHIFYPKEETVKFLNRFIRKKVGTNNFVNILKSEKNLRGLDFGCGIGRQTVLLAEFGIDSYGTDVSDEALKAASMLAEEFGLSSRCHFLKVTDEKLPFENDDFDFIISDSVLDSMQFSLAVQYMKEFSRITKKYIFLTLIGSEDDVADEFIVQTEHEKGTVQSVYNPDKIKELVSTIPFEIKFLNEVCIKDLMKNSLSKRYHLVLERK